MPIKQAQYSRKIHFLIKNYLLDLDDISRIARIEKDKLSVNLAEGGKIDSLV